MGTKVSWGEPGRKAITLGPKSALPPTVLPIRAKRRPAQNPYHSRKAEALGPSSESGGSRKSVINKPKATRQLKHRSKKYLAQAKTKVITIDIMKREVAHQHITLEKTT